jgi:hypothetical protein
MERHPHIQVLHHLFLSETQPFRKVHRMIDLFESLIKFHTVVILSEYVKHNRLSDNAKFLLAQGLYKPSLGVWKQIGSALFKELEEKNYNWLLPDFPIEFRKLDKALEQKKTNVIEFRNYYGHGATPPDEQCEADIQQFEPFLNQLLQLNWLNSSSILIREAKVYLVAAEGELSLHPVLIYREEKFPASLAFFNDLKNDKICLLNYPLCKFYKKEFELYWEFREYFPINAWKKSSKTRFDYRIEELTESFKGREDDLEILKGFVRKKNKGYLSVLGNPGIGKSTLIAQFIKELRADQDLKHVMVIDYFIHRGRNESRPETLLSYLIQKTDEIFREGRNIRPEKNDLWHLQEILFEKWRLWAERSKEKKLLILIDGLDEGAENKLTEYLPRENFENVLIIYGSRPGGHPNIIDFWPTLPQGHQEHELKGLTKEDIRALIYEVGNKYDIERESKWIDAVLERTNGTPLYLKLLCDAIENGSISLNDINTIPKEINNYYEAILRRYSKDKYKNALLQSLYTFAAAKDELSFSHLRIINKLDYATQEHVGSTLREILVKNEIGEVDTYQLFHETFRDFLIEKRKLEVQEAEERILDFCSIWEELEGTYEQHYALQHYASHLIESQKSKRKQELFHLLNNKSYIQTQKKVLRQFESTRTLLQIGLIEANEQKNWEAQLETALCLVDLKYDEANDIDSIIRMVADGEIDLALRRIENFREEDEEGFKAKFILYMLCLAELTLSGSKEKTFKKTALESLLDHLNQNIPANTSILDWGEFFPSYFAFLIACELEQIGIDYLVIYKRTRNWGKNWFSVNGPYSENQLNILLKIINETFEPIRKSLNPIEKIQDLILLMTECKKAGLKNETDNLIDEIIDLLFSYKNQILKTGTSISTLLKISFEISDLGFNKEIGPYIDSLLEDIFKIKDDSKKISCLVVVGELFEARKNYGISSKLIEEATIILPQIRNPEIDTLAKLSTLLIKKDPKKSKILIKSCQNKLKSSYKYQDYLFNYEIVTLELTKQDNLIEIFDIIMELDKEAENLILIKVLEQFCNHGDFINANIILEKINENEQNCDDAYKIIAIYNSKYQNFNLAISLINKIKDPVVKCHTSIDVFLEFLKNDKINLAQTILINTLFEFKKIKTQYHKEKLGLDLSNLILKHSTELQHSNFLKEYFESLIKSKVDLFDNQVIGEFSWELTKKGKINEAIILAQSFEGEDFEFNISEICRFLVNENRINLALKISELITHEWYKQDILLEISIKMSKNNLLPEAIKITNFLNSDRKSIAFVYISIAFENIGKKTKSTNFLIQSVENILLIQDSQYKAESFIKLFSLLKKLNKTEAYKKVLALTISYINENLKGEIRNKFLEATAIKLIEHRLFKEAYEICFQIKNRNIRDDTLFQTFEEIIAIQNSQENLQSINELIFENISKKRVKELYISFFKNQGIDTSNKSFLRTCPSDKEVLILSFYEQIPPEEKINVLNNIIKNTKLSGKRLYFDLIMEYTKIENWENAEKLILETSKPFIMSNVLEEYKNEKGWSKSLVLSDKIKNHELKEYFLGDWIAGISATESTQFLLQEAMPYFIYHTDSLEIILQKYALHETFLGNSTPQQLQRLNQTLDIQWALDIVDSFSEESETMDLSIN